MAVINFDVGIDYEFSPRIPIRIISEDGSTFEGRAFIDTGAEISIFDISVAEDLKLDLEHAEILALRGIGGRLSDVRVAKVEISIPGLEDVSAPCWAAFVENAATNFGNLLGLDALEAFDFGLSHSRRVAYFRPAS
jgi:hypothetical protein